MTGFDIAVILVVGFFGVVGWIRGFSWQLVGVLTIVLGFTVAYPISAALEPSMAGWLGYELTGKDWDVLGAADRRDVHLLARGASWATAFALIWLFTHILYYFFREAIERWHMEELNRALGALFGVVKGVLVVASVTLILMILGVERTRQSANTVRVQVPGLLRGSALAPSIGRTLRAARFALPANFATGIGHYLDALDGLNDETRAATVEERDVPEEPTTPPKPPPKKSPRKPSKKTPPPPDDTDS